MKYLRKTAASYRRISQEPCIKKKVIVSQGSNEVVLKHSSMSFSRLFHPVETCLSVGLGGVKNQSNLRKTVFTPSGACSDTFKPLREAIVRL